PVRRDLDTSAGEYEEVAGRQLPDALEHRARRRDDPQRQVLVKRVRIELCEARFESEERLDLGGECEALAVMPVVKRLLAEVIAREQQATLREIVERKGEHAAQTIEGAFAVAGEKP